MESEAMDGFERELRQALERMPAPPSLKRRIVERRTAEHAKRRLRRVVWWQRMAAATALLCALAGILIWRSAQRRREGEEARRQVILALRITNRALIQMELQLAAHNQKVLSRESNEQE